MGRCICYYGFNGLYCESKSICKSNCNYNGICIGDDICACSDNFTGKFCEKNLSHYQYRTEYNNSFIQLTSEENEISEALLKSNITYIIGKDQKEELFGYIIDYSNIAPYSLLTLILLSIALSVLMVKN
jgi:hypothetical protein